MLVTAQIRAAKELTTALERSLAPYDVTAQQAALLLRLRTETGPSRLFDGFASDDLQTLTLILGRMPDNLAAQW